MANTTEGKLKQQAMETLMGAMTVQDVDGAVINIALAVLSLSLDVFATDQDLKDVDEAAESMVPDEPDNEEQAE